MASPARPLSEFPRHPVGIRRHLKLTPAEQLDAFAQLAETDDWERVFPDVARAANVILDVQGYVTWAHVRLALFKVDKLTEAEKCAAAGRFARRMGLIAEKDERGNVIRERPSEEYNQVFPRSHANLATRWVRPRPRLLTDVERVMVPTR